MRVDFYTVSHFFFCLPLPYHSFPSKTSVYVLFCVREKFRGFRMHVRDYSKHGEAVQM